MENAKKLYEILQEICPDVDFDAEENLVDDGLIASLDLVTIVNELVDAFDIELSVDDLVPESFNSAKSMLRMIEAKQN